MATDVLARCMPSAMRRQDVDVHLNELSGRVLDAAIRVHRALGPGLLERAYRLCLVHELRRQGMHALTEIPVALSYEGLRVESGFRLDVLVEGTLVVEVKAVDVLHPVHAAQLRTYLRLTGNKVGLLLNFDAFPLAIRRVVATS